MYICICNAVTDLDIQRAVQEGHTDLSALQAVLDVGSCCGRCRPYAQSVIEETLALHPYAQTASLALEVHA